MKKNWNWGLTKNAETLNGRIAMIGIVPQNHEKNGIQCKNSK